MIISSSPVRSTPDCTCRTPTKSTAAVPAAIAVLTASPNAASVTESRTRACTVRSDLSI